MAEPGSGARPPDEETGAPGSATPDARPNRRAWVPSSRGRIATRGRELLKRKYFLRAIAATRDDWNAKHPEYRLPEDDPDPKHMAGDGDPPRALQAALRAARAANDHARLGTTGTASFDWLGLVNGVCQDWWPPEDFPLPAGPYAHPARTFVAACVRWGPDAADPAALVLPMTNLVTAFFFDPTQTDVAPHAMKAKAELRAYRDLVEGYVWRGRPLTPADLERFDAEAKDAGDRAFRAHVDEANPHRFLRLTPDMSSSDWRRLEPWVLENLDEEEHPAHQRARELAATGMSKSKIAFRLGISRPTVQRWLE